MASKLSVFAPCQCRYSVDLETSFPLQWKHGQCVCVLLKAPVTISNLLTSSKVQHQLLNTQVISTVSLIIIISYGYMH